jgi:hypothetical protein
MDANLLCHPFFRDGGRRFIATAVAGLMTNCRNRVVRIDLDERLRVAIEGAAGAGSLLQVLVHSQDDNGKFQKAADKL